MSDDYIVQTQGLSKNFKGFRALTDVNLRVRRGTIHALIGPNGAGKTTCFNLITKFLAPSKGRVFYKDQEITKLHPAEIAVLGMVRSFQISAVFLNLTVLENVRVAMQRKLGNSYHFWRSQTLLRGLHERVSELLTAVGLADYTDVPAVELPYGRKRALEIATTLALDPDVMLLDEPMAGMATAEVSRISDLIKRVAVNRTVLMVEHNLSVVADLSDYITVLHNGVILAEGTYEQISKKPEVIEAYMGTGDAQPE